MRRTLYACTLLLLFAACAGEGAPDQEAPLASEAAAHHTDTYGDQLGTVVFPTSCNEAAQRHLDRGLALLHHMTYEDAHQTFAAATDADPACAMGYWGQAMTFIHPLWPDAPTEAQLQQGWTLVQEAQARGSKTAREEAFIAALAAYYADGSNRDERARLASFEAGWTQVYEQFPDDIEGAAFYALAHMATAVPGDETYEKPQRAGAIAENILTQVPDHPGAHHYTIHAYDFPPLAQRALAVSRTYGKIAPAVPHALHMPTHIFTRLGEWTESIAWNERSATAALDHPVNGALSMHYLHALDYLAYAHLQRGEDQQARQVLATMQALEGPFQAHAGVAYTLAAVPARYALERQQWAAAAALEPRTPAQLPWDKFAQYEAITHFARALGATRSGDAATAREAINTLAALQEKTAQSSPYWAKQVEIQRTAAEAWLTYETGSPEDALALMEHAAALEASTNKHPITPGEVLPARELLGDMLLDMEHPDAALAAYLAALERSPERYNSLYGAGRAAELKGDQQTAATYYQKLVDGTPHADAGLERLQHAQAFLAANRATS